MTYLGEYTKGEASILHNLILSQKEFDMPCIADFFAYELSVILREKLPLDVREKEYIVSAVPRSKRSMNKYGFNQSASLAKRLAFHLGLDYYELLSYKGDDTTQKNLSVNERFENADNSYRIKKNSKKLINRHSVILVDDVYTTGATLASCSELIAECGSNRIDCAVIGKSSKK